MSKRKRNLFEEILDGFKYLASIRPKGDTSTCEDCERIGPVCDYCVHFYFNVGVNGAYTGDGYCRFHERPADPTEGCSDYTCGITKE